jgi:hypothetical protein
MRVRHAASAVAMLTVLGLAGCSDDPDPVAPAPAPAVSITPSADGASSGPGAPAASAASAEPGTPATEGTATAKPPKKGGGAGQGPFGKTTATP